MFNGGNALATVVAAPVGSYLGAMIGWRGAFFCLVPIAALAFVWQWFTLSSMPPPGGPLSSGNVLALLKRRLVMFGMLAVGTFFMGQFALFTYLRPFLETVTRVDVSTLSLILLALGIAGFVGTTVIGFFLRKVGLYATVAVIPVAMAAIAVTLLVAGASTPATAVLLTAWGLFATAAPVGWWLWLARSLPDDADAGGGLMVAVVQLSIAIGSTVGGLLFDHVGHQATFGFSAGLLLIAAVLVFATSGAGRLRAA
jgi:predicted MFS family arabinose efflux permease